MSDGAMIILVAITCLFLGGLALTTHLERMACIERGGDMVSNMCRFSPEPTPTAQEGD